MGVREEGDSLVRVTVADNGAGIAPEDLSRIFAHGVATRTGGRTFSLHSCSLIARQLGGELTAESAGLGRGATFTLTLPVRPL